MRKKKVLLTNHAEICKSPVIRSHPKTARSVGLSYTLRLNCANTFLREQGTISSITLQHLSLTMVASNPLTHSSNHRHLAYPGKKNPISNPHHQLPPAT